MVVLRMLWGMLMLTLTGVSPVVVCFAVIMFVRVVMRAAMFMFRIFLVWLGGVGVVRMLMAGGIVQSVPTDGQEAKSSRPRK